MSIFNLKKTTAELSSANQGHTQMSYWQRPPSRSIKGDNFPSGSIHFHFALSGIQWWIPARSYFRMRASLTKADGTQLDLADNIAPNMGLMANLFQSAEFRINGTTVSRVANNFAQVDAIENRLKKSKSWLDTAGASTNWWQAEFRERQNEVAVDGFNGKNLNYTDIIDANNTSLLDFYGLDITTPNQVQITANNELIFTPGAGTPIQDLTKSFFIGQKLRIVDGVGPQIRNIVSFATTNTLNDTIIVSGLALGAVGAGNLVAQVKAGYLVPNVKSASRQIKSFEMTWQPPLSIFKISHALPVGEYEIVLNPQTVNAFQQRAIESLGIDKTGAGTDYVFSVDTLYLYIARLNGTRVDNSSYLLDMESTTCQRQNITNGATLTQELFNVNPSVFALSVAFQDSRAEGNLTQYSASKFKLGTDDNERTLQRMYINYSGLNRPAPDADPSFKVGELVEDYTVQRYYDTMAYNGSLFDTGGPESIQEWASRGSYYYFLWPRDGTDRSKRATVHFQFQNNILNGTVLLFSHYKVTGRVKIENGRVINVQVEEI